VVTRAFFKASVMMGAFAAAGIVAFADPLIVLASGHEFIGAHRTLLLLAASIPFTAMTAPLTAVMKALDGVRAAFYCDLSWACVYIALMIGCASVLGLEGTGWAALAASLVQFVIAVRLATVRPSMAASAATLLRSVVCAVLAFLPAWLLLRTGGSLAIPLAFLLAVPVIFVVLARRARVLDADERERVKAVLARRGMGPALGWFIP
jgi:O-antigen/teichoic acid export membrane protein